MDAQTGLLRQEKTMLLTHGADQLGESTLPEADCRSLGTERLIHDLCTHGL